MKELYQKDNSEWALYPYIIRYTHKGEQVEQLTDDVEWFNKFADKWEDFTIDEVVELEYTQEQLDRLAEVQGIEAKHFNEIYDYVLNGSISVDSEVFAKKKTQELAQSLTNAELALVEVYELLLGVIM
jgi:hypothetical protein